MAGCPGAMMGPLGAIDKTDPGIQWRRSARAHASLLKPRYSRRCIEGLQCSRGTIALAISGEKTRNPAR
jgi:hypothetical protein